MSTFKERFKELKESRGLTYQQLADFLGLKQRTVQGYSAGTIDPPSSTLLKLADYFNVSTDYLLGREEPKEKAQEKTVPQLTSDEIRLLKAFRDNPDMKLAVFRLLGISNPDEVLVYRAARSLNHKAPTIEKMSSADIEKLRNAHTVTSDEDL